MIGRPGRSRKSRRNLLCGAWAASVGAAAGLVLALCQLGTAECGALLLTTALCGVLWHSVMIREGSVAVLVYHSVSTQGDWLPGSRKISVLPETFSRQMALLADLGCTVVRTSELVEAHKAGRSLGRRPVVLHFDDGYLDNWVAALPVLEAHGFPATVFVSTDFVEPGDTLRPKLSDVAAGRAQEQDVGWQGYLNWAELRAMEGTGLIDVECHGTDHARVPVSDRAVGRLNHHNWRRHAWVQWRHMPGNKSQWYRHKAPPFEPIGSPIPENEPALAARAWHDGERESEADLERRVENALRTAKTTVEKALNKPVLVFCWPFDASTASAHALALKAGFLATTGGEKENRPSEDPTRISRLHIHESVLGWPIRWLDDLVFVANVRLMHGNYYWGLVVIPVNVFRRIIQFLAPKS